MTFSDPVDTQVSGPGPVPAGTEEPTQKLDVKAQAKARISRIPTATYAVFAGAAILVVGLVWWRGRR